MYILLTAATYNEINTTIEWIRSNNGSVHRHEVEVLITGVGSTAAAYALTRQLMLRTPELVVQAGIGGSFDERLAPGSLAFIDEEVFADLGVNDADEFHDLFDLGLAASDKKPFTERMLVNPYIDNWQRFGLPFVRGATINCISSTVEEAERIKKKYHPIIESMEGAAMHYACLMEEIPFIQLRAISNFVGERDKSKWKMREAIELLNDRLMKILAMM